MYIRNKTSQWLHRARLTEEEIGEKTQVHSANWHHSCHGVCITSSYQTPKSASSTSKRSRGETIQLMDDDSDKDVDVVEEVLFNLIQQKMAEMQDDDDDKLADAQCRLGTFFTDVILVGDSTAQLGTYWISN